MKLKKGKTSIWFRSINLFGLIITTQKLLEQSTIITNLSIEELIDDISKTIKNEKRKR